MIRHLFAGSCALVGTLVVLVTVIGLNTLEGIGDDEPVQQAVTFEVQAPKPKPPAPRPRPKPKPRKTSRTPPPPIPILGASLSGFEIDLPMLGEGLLDGAAGELVGDARDVVMTADALGEAPTPKRQVAPEYPSRARARGVQGKVVVSILIGADGHVRDPRIVSSDPPGVFDQAALAAAAKWEFEPVLYEGRAVSARWDLPFLFRLE